MGQAQEIRVNGREISFKAATIADLLVEQAIDKDRRGIAVALNGSVIPRSAWDETAVRPGDSVEIVRAMQGG
jgi:sulfur carrier protein